MQSAVCTQGNVFSFDWHQQCWRRFDQKRPEPMVPEKRYGSGEGTRNKNCPVTWGGGGGLNEQGQIWSSPV